MTTTISAIEISNPLHRKSRVNNSRVRNPELTHADPEFVGVSRNIQKVKAIIDKVADAGLNVIVTGETGVGKELVVQSLYRKSDRVNKPFIKVNCAALPDTLLESEMFGYERGAFTGAEKQRRGKFELANGGVLFLDEIGDMSFPLQSKLLHVLQSGDYTPLGSEKQMQTDVWVVAATNHDLDHSVDAGEFREDLFYRISTIKIKIEPLRNRPEDIPHLIDHYVNKYSSQFNHQQPVVLSDRTIEKLCGYHWPGNVRELQNVLKRILLLGENRETVDDMLTAPHGAVAEKKYMSTAKESLLETILGIRSGQEPDINALSLKKIRKETANHVESEIIAHVLKFTGWNRWKAAKILKVSYKTLLLKIELLSIEPPPELR